MVLENFLCVTWLCSIYLRGAFDIGLHARKRIRNTRRTKQILWQETRKKLNFQKSILKVAMELSCENLNFWPKSFFQMVLENFLCVAWLCSIYLRGASDIGPYARKGIRNARRTKQILWQET